MLLRCYNNLPEVNGAYLACYGYVSPLPPATGRLNFKESTHDGTIAREPRHNADFVRCASATASPSA